MKPRAKYVLQLNQSAFWGFMVRLPALVKSVLVMAED